MVVNVSLLAMLGCVVLQLVVVTMSQLIVVVLVRVPGRTVLPLAEWHVSVVVRDVIVIVGVHPWRMGVLRFSSLAFSSLRICFGRHDPNSFRVWTALFRYLITAAYMPRRSPGLYA